MTAGASNADLMLVSGPTLLQRFPDISHHCHFAPLSPENASPSHSNETSRIIVISHHSHLNETSRIIVISHHSHLAPVAL